MSKVPRRLHLRCASSAMGGGSDAGSIGVAGAQHLTSPLPPPPRSSHPLTWHGWQLPPITCTHEPSRRRDRKEERKPGQATPQPLPRPSPGTSPAPSPPPPAPPIPSPGTVAAASHQLHPRPRPRAPLADRVRNAALPPRNRNGAHPPQEGVVGGVEWIAANPTTPSWGRRAPLRLGGQPQRGGVGLGPGRSSPAGWQVGWQAEARLQGGRRANRESGTATPPAHQPTHPHARPTRPTRSPTPMSISI